MRSLGITVGSLLGAGLLCSKIDFKKKSATENAVYGVAAVALAAYALYRVGNSIDEIAKPVPSTDSIIGGARIDGTPFNFALDDEVFSPTMIPSDLATLVLWKVPGIDDDTILAIAQQAPQLSKLQIVDPDGMSSLITGSFFNTLPDQFTEFLIDTPACLDLEGLDRLTQLKTLILSTEMTQERLVQLCLPENLVGLHLSIIDEITDVSSIASAALTDLTISGRLTDKAAKQIAEMTSLQFLDVTECSEYAVEIFRRMTSLETLIKGSEEIPLVTLPQVVGPCVRHTTAGAT